MFTAWDVLTSQEVGNVGLDKIQSPSQFSQNIYNNKNFELLKDYYPWASVFWNKLNMDNFWFCENENVKYGGITQWCQSNLDKSDWFVGDGDFHPSPTAHAEFSKQVVYPLLKSMEKIY